MPTPEEIVKKALEAGGITPRSADEIAEELKAKPIELPVEKPVVKIVEVVEETERPRYIAGNLQPVNRK